MGSDSPEEMRKGFQVGALLDMTVGGRDWMFERAGGATEEAAEVEDDPVGKRAQGSYADVCAPKDESGIITFFAGARGVGVTAILEEGL